MIVSVAVYPRLGELLQARNLTVAELSRQIERRFGLTVDAATLDAWAREAQVQRADLELAGATAAVLDVSLADLFAVNAIPDLPEEVSVLDAADAERLSELLDLQQSRELVAAEADELKFLIAEYGRRAQEIGLKAIAAQHGISLEQARREREADLDSAARWLAEFEADPKRRRAVVSQLRRRNRHTTSAT